MSFPKSSAALAGVALSVALLTGSAQATSANTDYSDIWWNPAESGWGMQMINTGTFIFATLYVYRADQTPIWYTGELEKSTAGALTFSGPLYLSSGPYFLQPFNPNAVSSVVVGNMSFTPTSDTTASLAYSVSGNTVIKSVQRQPLTLDSYNGNFQGTLSLSASHCIPPSYNAPRTPEFTYFSFSQAGAAISLTTTYRANGYSCTHNGNYVQFGRMGQFAATYTCDGGDRGSSQFSNLNNTPNGVLGTFTMDSAVNNCQYVGDLAASRQ